MTPQAERAKHRRAIQRRGEPVTFRKMVNGLPVDATVWARMTGFSPEELASGIMQGDRKAIVLAEEIEAAGLVIEPNDALIVRGGRLNIESVDDSTRRIGGVLIAYELGVRG